MAEDTDIKEKYAMGQDMLSVGAKTANVASFLTLGKFLALFFTGSAFIIVARVLGPASYGIFILAVALSGFFNPLLDLGVSTSFSRFISEYTTHDKKEEIGKLLSNGYIIIVIMALVICSAIFLLSGMLSNYIFGSQANINIIKLVSLATASCIIYGTSYSALCGFGKGKYIALVLVIQAIIQSIVSIALALLGLGAVAPLMGLVSGYLSAAALSLSIIYIKLKIRFGRPSLSGVKKLLGFSVPLAGYNTLRSFTSNVSPIVLGIFASTVVVGNFGVALKTGNIIAVVTDSLALSALLMFSSMISVKKLKKSLNKIYNYTIYITYLLITPVMFYIALLSKEISFTAFSAEYALAPLYLSMISMGVLLWVMATYTINLLIGANKVREIFKYSIIVSVMEILLLFALVPLFKGVGLIVLLYFITPVLLIIFGLRAGKPLNISLDVVRHLKIIIAAFISICFVLPILLIFNGNYILILISAAVEQIILYPIIIAITGAAHKRDLEGLKGIVKALPVINKLVNLLADYSARFARS